MLLKTTLKALAAYEGGESRDCECWPGSPSIQRSSCIIADSAATWIGQTKSSFLSSSNEMPAGPNGKAIDLIKAAAFEAQMGLFAGAAVIQTLTLKIKITVCYFFITLDTWRGLGVWLHKALFPSFPSPHPTLSSSTVQHERNTCFLGRSSLCLEGLHNQCRQHCA